VEENFAPLNTESMHLVRNPGQRNSSARLVVLTCTLQGSFAWGVTSVQPFPIYAAFALVHRADEAAVQWLGAFCKS